MLDVDGHRLNQYGFGCITYVKYIYMEQHINEDVNYTANTHLSGGGGGVTQGQPLK